MYTYAYIVGALIPFPLWVVFFARRKDLRKEMIMVGTNVGLIAIITDFTWTQKDYWNPLKYISVSNFTWQEFLVGFILGGILAVPYEVFSNKEIEVSKFDLKRSMFLLFTILSSFFIFTNLLKINSIYSSIIGLLMSFILVLFTRKDLLINSFVSGLLALMVSVILYSVYLIIYPDIFYDWWLLNNISGIFVWKIPIEELIWFTSFGMVAGASYKFSHSE